MFGSSLAQIVNLIKMLKYIAKGILSYRILRNEWNIVLHSVMVLVFAYHLAYAKLIQFRRSILLVVSACLITLKEIISLS